MSWTPPERPDWVRAINAGEVASIAEEAAHPLTRDALIGEAAARQGRVGDSPAACARALGRPGFEAEPVIENLDRVLGALEREARLNTVGRHIVEFPFPIMDRHQLPVPGAQGAVPFMLEEYRDCALKFFSLEQGAKALALHGNDGTAFMLFRIGRSAEIDTGSHQIDQVTRRINQ